MTGTGLEAFGLGFLSKIIQTLFGEAIKDRLRGKSSSEIARVRAYHLYQKLKEVSDKTNFFVVALQSYTKAVSSLPSTDVQRYRVRKDPEEEIFWEARDDLGTAASELFEAMQQLEGALNRVYTQLDVHHPKLVRDISFYSDQEMRIYGPGGIFDQFGQINEALGENEALDEGGTRAQSMLSSDTSKVLQQLVKFAQRNERVIKAATNDMRAFLRKEFPFKESF